MKMVTLIDYKTLTPLFFLRLSASSRKQNLLIFEMLKRRGLIRFGDAIIIEGFYSYKNYLIGIRYGVVPLIIKEEVQV